MLAPPHVATFLIDSIYERRDDWHIFRQRPQRFRRQAHEISQSLVRDLIHHPPFDADAQEH
jgi:hypothetical protein